MRLELALQKAQNPFPEVVSYRLPELLIQIERESLRLGPPFFHRGPGDPERTLAPLSGA